MTEPNTFSPDWLSPPGESIEDALEERGWTQLELAQRLGVSPKFINQLIRGKVSLTPDTAILLSSVLGSPAEFWLRREADYRSAMAQQEERLRLTDQIGWLSELPVSDMAKRGWIPRLKDKADQVAACLRFFGVSSVDTWRQHYEQPLVAFRASPTFTQQHGAVAAWLRRAELEATKLDVARFDGAALRRELHSLRSLTREHDPQVFVPQLVKRCAACGVAVVFVPAPKGCRASGATSWLGSGKAMLVLSLRHKTDDHLWFTFFHEGFHLVLHGRDMLFVEGLDGLDSAQEQEANQAAADLLIPPKQASQLAGLPRKPELAIELAREWGVAPGIVVGRLQHNRDWPYTVGNYLKVYYQWQDSSDTD